MKAYFKFILALYYAALLVCGVCRIWLKLYHMDVDTGFYTVGGLPVTIFNVMLGAAPVIMFASNRLKRTDNDYPVSMESGLLGILALITGVALIAFALVGAPEAHLKQGLSETFYQVGKYVCMALGALSGMSFLYLGAGVVRRRSRPPAAMLLIIPPLWQGMLLLMRFNGYTTVSSISDHLLAVLFMVFNSLFLMGHARTLRFQMRKDGRNYCVPAGLCASLCGFLLVIPNFVYMAVNQTAMPVALLGLFESVYVLSASLYALAFASGIMRSVKDV